jgi:1-phosphofructokinase
MAVIAAAETASWVVLSGSLPPGVPDHWYAHVVALLAPYPCRVAVDTSDGPLAALVESLGRAAPDLIKPNAEELAGVLGYSPQALEAAVAQGDPEPVVTAARQLVDRGVGAVLATLGASGAVLVDETGSWMAAPPPIVARSTVGAGDASLAGYLRADVGGAVPPARLQMAVAYGSAAAALPGSALPAPAQVDLDAVRVTPIAPNAPITNTKVSP